MKNFQKPIIFSIVLILVSPQIVFAAWWNPFTWNIFQKKVVPVVQEIKVPEITQTIVEENYKKIQQDEESSQLITNKNANTVPPAPSTKIFISCNGELHEDTCRSQGLKLFCIEDKYYCSTQRMDNLKLCNGVAYSDNCGSTSKFFCPSSGSPYCKANTSDFDAINAMIQSQKEKDDLKKQQEEARKNSPECKAASDSLNRIREERKILQEKSKKSSDAYYGANKSGGNSSSLFLESVKDSEDYFSISKKESQAFSDWSSACEGIFITPSIPKTYNTTCYTSSYGTINTTNCSTY